MLCLAVTGPSCLAVSHSPSGFQSNVQCLVMKISRSLTVYSQHSEHVHRLSGNEAAVMDPQGRVLLETTAGALADTAAGATGPAPAATGVYVGVMHMEYIQYMTGAFLASISSMRSCNDSQAALRTDCFARFSLHRWCPMPLNLAHLQDWASRWGQRCRPATAWTSWSAGCPTPSASLVSTDLCLSAHIQSTCVTFAIPCIRRTSL